MKSRIIFSFIFVLICAVMSLWLFAISVVVAIILNFSKKKIPLGICSVFLAFVSPIYPLLLLPSLIALSIYFMEVLKETEGWVRTYALFFLSASLAVFFIIAPIMNLFVNANIAESFQDSALIKAIFTGLVASFIATVIAIFLALPISYILARHRFPGKEIIEAIIDLPVIIPHIVAGIMLLLIYGPSGSIGKPLENAGIVFYYALPGTVIAMLFVSFPIVASGIREGIRKVDFRQELVAMSLGASRTKAIFTITIPQIKRVILSSSLLAWARGMSEFGAIIIIAYYPMVASTYIYYLYTQYGLSRALPATALLLIITLSVFIVVRFLGREKDAED